MLGVIFDFSNWDIEHWASLVAIIMAFGGVFWGLAKYIVALNSNTDATKTLTSTMSAMQTHLNNTDVRIQKHDDELADHEHRINRLEQVTDTAKEGNK